MPHHILKRAIFLSGQASQTNAQQTYVQDTLGITPTAYWSFDSDFTDSSPNGYDLTSAGTSSAGNATLVAGSDGSASFATDGVATIADTDALEIPDGADWICSFWFKCGVQSGTTAFVQKRASTGTGYEFLMNTAGQPQFLIDSVGAAARVLSSSNEWDDGAWHHVCLWIDPSLGSLEIKFYLDGVLVDQDNDAYAAGGTPNSEQFKTGRRHSTGPFYDGGLDELWIGNVAIDATQTEALWEQGLDPVSKVLRSLDVEHVYKFDETVGTKARSIGSATRNLGTYTNGPTLNQASLLAGVDNPCVSFDGAGDYVAWGTTSTLDYQSDWIFSWGCFCTADALSPDAFFSNSSGANLNGIVIFVSNDGSLRCVLRNGTTEESHTTGAGYYSAGETFAPGVVCNGTSLQFYKNGSPYGSPQTISIATGSATSDQAPQWCAQNGGITFDGKVQLQWITGSALSDANMSAVYSAGGGWA